MPLDSEPRPLLWRGGVQLGTTVTQGRVGESTMPGKCLLRASQGGPADVLFCSVRHFICSSRLRALLLCLI